MVKNQVIYIWDVVDVVVVSGFDVVHVVVVHVAVVVIPVVDPRNLHLKFG